MKKDFLLLVVFLCSIFGYGQHTYLLEYKASFSTISVQPAWSNNILYTEDGDDKLIFSVSSSSTIASADVFYKFTTNNPIDSLKARSSSFSGTLTGCISFTSSDRVFFNECSSNYKLRFN